LNKESIVIIDENEMSRIKKAKKSRSNQSEKLNEIKLFGPYKKRAGNAPQASQIV
jgi:hypothetical protein